MKVEGYQFLFHPLHEEHTAAKKALAIITNVALTILSCGVYALVFAAVHLRERCSVQEEAPKVDKAAQKVVGHQQGFVGVEALKKKQANHLKKLFQLSPVDISQHTAHPDSAFDWWMLSTDRSSSAYGDRYKLSHQDVQKLLQDGEFMKSYRNGVIHIASSWGCNLFEGNMEIGDLNEWKGYWIRLAKMLHSLTLFNQKDLHHKVVAWIDSKHLREGLLEHEPWVRRYLFC